MSRLKSYAGISRLPFLLLPVVLVAAGTAAAAWDSGYISIHDALLALAGLLALHIGVNAINEASDARRGIDQENPRTPFSGGSGTVPSGKISVRAAALYGFASTGAGLLVGLWFLFRVGWVMLPLIAIAAILVVGYTDFFARTGLGETAAGLGLGALPVIGSALVQHGTIGTAAVAVGIISFMLTFNLLLLNEFPDQDMDRNGGRKNLVIILGTHKAAMIWLVIALGVPFLIMIMVMAGILPWPVLPGMLPVIILRDALRWAHRKSMEEPVPPIASLRANVLWNLATHLLVALGLLCACWLI